MGSPLHIISSLFRHFCLFQNAILNKMLKLEFWNFKPIFFRMQHQLVVTFFFSSFGYQFELIFASYNQLPDTSYLKLWKPNGLFKHLKGSQTIGLDLCTKAKLAVKWIILKWYYAVDLIFDSIWIILVFYCNFCAFKIILNFTFHIFIFFYPETSQTYTITSMTFQVPKM